MKRIVLEASALMTFFHDRPGAEKVEQVMKVAVERKRKLYFSVVNWGEVYYSVWRANGQASARQIATEISQLPIEIVDADLELTRSAAAFRAQHKLPYADCFAAALARAMKAELLTSDRDFSLVGRQVDVTLI